jgi:2-oxoglutarate ferredoxin oxidoreductase subunit beta
MNTYGFHGIHGRAGAIASGVKAANPKLSVWQITGDGDGLAIGGNHFIHEIRRNIDLNVLLFNNEIYGLTKGQYSPTTKYGTKTKTSPYGTVEEPFKVGQLAMGAGATFFARALDNNIKHCTKTFVEAENHRGTSLVEILVNCVIYADQTHALITDKEHKADRQLYLEHGEKMIFGNDNEKGIVLDHGNLKTVTIGKDGFTEDDILVHDAKNPDPIIHMMLANMKAPDMPVAFGVIRAVEAMTYDRALEGRIAETIAASKIHTMDDLLNSGETWTVE